MSKTHRGEHDSMSWLSEFLKDMNIIPRFNRDDELNAEADRALAAQRRAVESAKSEFEKLHKKGEALRNVMQDARLRLNTFAQFEQRIRDMTKGGPN